MGILVLLTTHAYAGAMSIQATGTETGSYDSNPLLATSGGRSLWGSTTEPDLLFKDATPTSSLSSDSKVDENVFNQSAFNSTDGHEAANFATSNAQWKFAVKGQGDYDTTRTSEITNFGLAPVVTRHTGLNAAPQLSYTPDAADTLSLAGGAQSSTYHDHIFTDYENFSVTPTYTHALDPLNAVFLSTQAQRYQTTDNLLTHVDSINPTIGWQTTLSPRLNANTAVGAQAVRSYQGSTETSPWTWQYTFAAGLTYTGIQDTLNLTANRQQIPYGNGTDALQTAIVASETHNLNALFSLTGGGTYLLSTYPSYSPNSLKDLAIANAGATYHATEHLDVTASYQYRYETLTASSATASDNAVMLSLAYHPKLWTFR